MTASEQQREAARAMIRKLRTFAASLDENERAALDALLVPGVAAAFDEGEVEGHAATIWSADALPGWLSEAVLAEGVRLDLTSGTDPSGTSG